MTRKKSSPLVSHVRYSVGRHPGSTHQATISFLAHFPEEYRTGFRPAESDLGNRDRARCLRSASFQWRPLLGHYIGRLIPAARP